MQHACWAPDGQHILVVSDFQIRISVWSLVTKLCVHLPGPKLPASSLAFSADGCMLALAEVRARPGSPSLPCTLR